MSGGASAQITNFFRESAAREQGVKDGARYGMGGMGGMGAMAGMMGGMGGMMAMGIMSNMMSPHGMGFGRW